MERPRNLAEQKSEKKRTSCVADARFPSIIRSAAAHVCFSLINSTHAVHILVLFNNSSVSFVQQSSWKITKRQKAMTEPTSKKKDNCRCTKHKFREICISHRNHTTNNAFESRTPTGFSVFSVKRTLMLNSLPLHCFADETTNATNEPASEQRLDDWRIWIEAELLMEFTRKAQWAEHLCYCLRDQYWYMPYTPTQTDTHAWRLCSRLQTTLNIHIYILLTHYIVLGHWRLRNEWWMIHYTSQSSTLCDMHCSPILMNLTRCAIWLRWYMNLAGVVAAVVDVGIFIPIFG